MPLQRSVGGAPVCLVVQRYVPSYRVPLFTALHARLRGAGVDMVVCSGRPAAGSAARQDAATDRHEWLRPCQEVAVTVGRSQFKLMQLPPAPAGSVVVAELGSTSLTSHRRLLTDPRHTVLWGHGRAYVSRRNVLDQAIETAMARRARLTLTYTEAGRVDLVERGVPAGRVTSVGNSTDTETIRELMRSSGDGAAVWRERLDLPPRPALYVGGIDQDKRIDFLLEAAEGAAAADPGFCLVVGGSGAEDWKVRRLQHAPFIRWVPRLSTPDLVAVAASCTAIWMPGRIGLVAVDALALGLPVYASPFDFHAPERDYLVEGRDVFTLPGSARAFGAQAARLAAARGRPGTLLPLSQIPTISAVAERFTDAVLGVLG